MLTWYNRAKYYLDFDDDSSEDECLATTCKSGLWKLHSYFEEAVNLHNTGGLSAPYGKYPRTEGGSVGGNKLKTRVYRGMIYRALVQQLKMGRYCKPENVVVKWD